MKVMKDMKEEIEEVFDGDYINNLKLLLNRLKESDFKDITKANRIHIMVVIERMKEVSDYCKDLGIEDRIVLHDVEDIQDYMEDIKNFNKKGIMIKEY